MYSSVRCLTEEKIISKITGITLALGHEPRAGDKRIREAFLMAIGAINTNLDVAPEKRQEQVDLLVKAGLTATKNGGRSRDLLLRILVPELAATTSGRPGSIDEQKDNIFSKRVMKQLGFVVLVDMPFIEDFFAQEKVEMTPAFRAFYEEYQKLASEK